VKELVPETTGGLWSIILGIAFAVTSLGGAWGFNKLSAEQAWLWAGAAITLILGHQARRALEGKKRE